MRPSSAERMPMRAKPRAAEFFLSAWETLPQEQRMLDLENRLANGLINGEELQALVPRLSSFERGELGSFIGALLPAEPYATAFFACWNDMPYEMRERLIKHAIEEEPARAFLIAPFVNLVTLCEHAFSYRSRQDPAETAPAKFKYADLNMLPRGRRFTDVHPFSFSQSTVLMEEALRSRNSIFMERLFAYLADRPALLFPYLPHIASSGLMRPEQIKTWMQNHSFGVVNASFFRDEYFATPEEAAERNRIEEEVKRKYPKHQHELAVGYSNTHTHVPRAVRAQWRAIVERGRLRGAAHVFSSWPEFATLLDAKQREELLRRLMNVQVPIFLYISSWEKDVADVRGFIRRMEKEGLELFPASDLEDVRALISAGHENEVVDYVLRDVRTYHGDSYFVQALMRQWDRARAWFSKDATSKISSAITKECPEVWTGTLNLALKEQIVPMSKIVEGLRRNGVSSFLNAFERLMFYAKQKPPVSPAADLSPEMLKAQAGETFMENPACFFRETRRIERWFSVKEMDTAVKKAIAGSTDAYFFATAANAVLENPRWTAFRQDVADRVASDADLFVGVYEQKSSSMPMLFGPREFESLFFRHLPLIHFSQDMRFEGLQWLFGNRQRALRLVRAFEKADRMQEAIDFARQLEWLFKRQKEYADQKKKKKGQPPDAKTDQPPFLPEKEATLQASHRELMCLVQRWATKHPWFYFEHPHALLIKGLPSSAIPWDRVNAFLREYPEDARKILLHAPEQMIPELARANAVALAFSDRSDDFPPLPVETVDTIMELHPLMRVEKVRAHHRNGKDWSLSERTSTEEDYYDAALRECRGSRWYPLVRETLEKIARDEREKEGEQTKPEYVNVPPLFRESVARMAILETEPSLQALLPEVLALPHEERQRVASLLAVAVLHGWFKEDGWATGHALPSVVERLQEKAKEHFSRVFHLSATEAIPRSFSYDLFAAFQEYYRNACTDEPELQTMMREMIVHGGADEYPTWKTWNGGIGEASLRDLQARAWVPKAMTLESYEHWVEDERMELHAMLRWDVEDIGQGLRRSLDQAVADHHLPAETLQIDESRILEDERRLSVPLFEKQERLGDLQRKMKSAKQEKRPFAEAEEYAALQQEIVAYRSEHAADLQKVHALRFLKRLPHVTVQEIEKKAFIIEKKTVPWIQAFKTLEEAFRVEHPEFLQDVARIRDQLYAGFDQLFGGARVSRETLEVTDRTDVETAFFIGEQPVASCQNYKSSGHFNRGLLSVVADPNVKIIQVRNASGGLIARSVLRLLADAEGKPELFLERVYSTNPHPKITEAITAFAKRKSGAMGCALYSHSAEGVGEASVERVTTTLVSHGARAPYVYTDAGGGLKRGGRYRIVNPVEL